MDILDEPQTGGYTTNLSQLQDLHGSYQTLHLTWSSIETTNGSGTTSGTLTDPYGALASMQGIASTQGIKFSLTIRPIDATGKTIPGDLSSLNFNDATLITRFTKLIDFVLTKIPKTSLINLMIGNEVDDYNPSGDANFWVEYAQFLNQIKTHVEIIIPVYKWVLQPPLADLLIPQKQHRMDGTPNPFYKPWPNTATSSEAVSIPIHIQEVGYATSMATLGDENKQAQFFCNVMQAWDTHQARIPRLAVLRMNDITRTKAEQMAGSYSSSAETFIEYLRTLGLRSYSGQAKPAYAIIKSEALKRGF